MIGLLFLVICTLVLARESPSDDSHHSHPEPFVHHTTNKLSSSDDSTVVRIVIKMYSDSSCTHGQSVEESWLVGKCMPNVHGQDVGQKFYAPTAYVRYDLHANAITVQGYGSMADCMGGTKRQYYLSVAQDRCDRFTSSLTYATVSGVSSMPSGFSCTSSTGCQLQQYYHEGTCQATNSFLGYWFSTATHCAQSQTCQARSAKAPYYETKTCLAGRHHYSPYLVYYIIAGVLFLLCGGFCCICGVIWCCCSALTGDEDAACAGCACLMLGCSLCADA